MIEDPSHFSVKIHQALEGYRKQIASMTNCDHERAKMILATISDMCGRAQALHDAVMARKAGEENRARNYIAAANVGMPRG